MQADVISIKEIPVQALDSPGGGDIYASGIFYGKVNNLPLKEYGRIRSFLGGKLVEIYGTNLSD